MPIDEFFKNMNNKQVSIPAVSRFLRQSCEFEAPIRNSRTTLENNLNRIGLGMARDNRINNGNGWNSDIHSDGGDAELNGQYYNSCEISASPFHGTSYREIKAEFDRIMEIYIQASGGLAHSYYSSTHTHTSVAYLGETANNVAIDLPANKMYRNVGGFFVRFMPVFKWLSMTNIRGARAAHGNSYDSLDGDRLYEWANNINSLGQHTASTDQYLTDMQRSSMLRIYRTEVFHFENRMMDCNFSATMMAAWFCLNRAVALFAYDMARQDYVFMPNANELESSRQASAHHRSGWTNVPKPFIVSEWALMKSYLTKYFKLSDSMDALDVLDKLIDCPIPKFLADQNIRGYYDPTIIEKHFAVRVREKDNELRSKYLDGIRKFLIPHAANLNDFHMQVAAYLGVEQKQAVSLYQMLKRENVDLEFLSGRLVYLGD